MEIGVWNSLYSVYGVLLRLGEVRVRVRVRVSVSITLTPSLTLTLEIEFQATNPKPTYNANLFSRMADKPSKGSNSNTSKYGSIRLSSAAAAVTV